MIFQKLVVLIGEKTYKNNITIHRSCDCIIPFDAIDGSWNNQAERIRAHPSGGLQFHS